MHHDEREQKWPQTSPFSRTKTRENYVNIWDFNIKKRKEKNRQDKHAKGEATYDMSTNFKALIFWKANTDQTILFFPLGFRRSLLVRCSTRTETVEPRQQESIDTSSSN